MTKTDLIAQVAANTEMSKKSAEMAVNAAFEALGKAVSEAKAGKIEYRLDKQNIIHVPVGKASFGAEKLYTNLDTVMSAIAKAKPAAAKGTYFKSATIATTMGPGIRLNTLKYGV